MKTAAELTPFVRYLLLFLAGMVQQGGMIPPDLANAMAQDPAVVDLVASLLIAGGAFGISGAPRARRWQVCSDDPQPSETIPLRRGRRRSSCLRAVAALGCRARLPSQPNGRSVGADPRCKDH